MFNSIKSISNTLFGTSFGLRPEVKMFLDKVYRERWTNDGKSISYESLSKDGKDTYPQVRPEYLKYSSCTNDWMVLNSLEEKYFKVISNKLDEETKENREKEVLKKLKVYSSEI